jgi:hypothetical protein
MGWFIRSEAEQKAYRQQKAIAHEERERKQRISDKIKYDEDQAVHRGRLKYLEKDAAKGGGSKRGGGFFDGMVGFVGSGAKDLMRNAASNMDRGIGISGPTYDSGARGGMAFNPITGETYTKRRKRK